MTELLAEDEGNELPGADDLTAVDPAIDQDEATAEVTARRRRVLDRAVAEWSGQLIDLGGRNTLLYFRDLKVGTLDLGDAERAALEALVAGKTTSLSQLYPDAEQRSAQARRCRALRAKARENLEERGLRTLTLGVGMATWADDRSAATPAAPLLLRSLSLSARSGSEEDFQFVAQDEWEFNPTLAHKMRTDFEVEIDAEDLVDLAVDESGRVDLDRVSAALAERAESVTGFEASPRWIAANLSYAKMPMVSDLQSSIETLAEHAMVCALAGSTDDRASIREAQVAASLGVDESAPDRMEPADEYLVLDADASQSHVINLAVAGANLVVQGPPGTGKSQTIANLVATLLARGRSVLFVAEKRAAIDAVVDRLNKVGLGDVVLDLHEGTGSRKRLAADLERTLRSMGKIPEQDFRSVQRTLVSRRDSLNDHARALHEKRAPWGMSAYELQARLVGIPDDRRTDLRLFDRELRSFGADALDDARDQLAEWVNLGGIEVELARTPWSGAVDHVTSAEDVAAMLRFLTDLRVTHLPTARTRVSDLARLAGIREPITLADAVGLVALVESVNESLARLKDEVYATDLRSVLVGLERGRNGGASAAVAAMFNRDYKAAKRAARQLTLSEKEGTADLYVLLAGAQECSDQWSTWTVDHARPHRIEGTEEVAESLRQLKLSLEVVAQRLGAPMDDDQSFDQLSTWLDALAADQSTLQRLPRIAELRGALRTRSLGPLLVEIAHRGFTAQEAQDRLLWLHDRSLFDHMASIDQRVGAFDGNHQATVVREFVAADVEQIESGVPRVKRALAEAAVRARNEHPEQSNVLETNARRKRRQASIRDLVQQAPDVLLALRPCWVMSPLVVAQLLPGGRPYFDVVVFDEASQIRPADAISSLARGRQVVIAGDSKQLPPTSFFDASVTSADGDGDDGALPPSYTEDMDSILDAVGALLPPPHGSLTLNWHYRSHDERLIGFSNAQPELYDWSLITFPGVVGDGCLRHVHVPFDSASRSMVDSSSSEVARVVEMIEEHARTRPDESLGVIAMGLKHAERIHEALRLRRRDDPALDATPCLDESRQDDPFFVKNLERVQGDERDAIILTVGYPKTDDGRMQYRFGPLNQEGGERRLNVAITRARQRMSVVSSFEPEDMDEDRLKSEGARMLKRYLAYARSGGVELGDHAMAKPDLNLFEVDVKTRLLRAGIPVIPQYGVAGYWIDFAAKHPTRPGEMVLAVEADGAAYHSAATARARDRLRQEHLERLGWRFHRIWSTDWFRDPEREVERVRAAYDAAVADADARREGRETRPPPVTERAIEPATQPQRGRRPPVIAGRSISDYSRSDLDAICRWVQSDTFLRTDDQLLEEMMSELGFRRRGSRIVEALQASITRVRNAT